MKDLEEVVITSCMSVMFMILFPLLQGYMIGLDTSRWSFAGASGVIAFTRATPFIFLIAGVCMMVYAIARRLRE